MRLTQEAKRRLADLPENRRRFAEEALHKVMHRFFGEAPDRIEVVVSLMLDAFERDDYWAVLKSIDDATRSDVARLAEALDEFGLVDLAIIATQSRGRLAFLDELEALAANPATLEQQLHHAIERNLWVLGTDFGVISSNKTMRRVVGDWLDRKFTGPRASKRPDLLLAQELRGRVVLIEFKRPSHYIERADENQAAEYRDDLAPLVNGEIEVVLIGKGRHPSVPSPASSGPTGTSLSVCRSTVARPREFEGPLSKM